MTKTRVLVPVVLAAVLAAGCLRKDTTHTLYLSPDGSVRWVAAESDVWSDDEDLGARLAEEQRYIGAALIGAHPVALGLKALEPEMMSTTVIRDERPFHVVTTASFGRIDRMMERLFRHNGVPTTARLAYDGTRTTLRMEFDFTRGSVDIESPATVLLEEIEHFTFVLTAGRFIPGGGFEAPERAGRARLSSEWLKLADEAADARRKIELVLAWE